ncbi:DUF2141 domain-containing protein [Novipirellula artificiosorum]|uniref:DUF2141 domain-containing protein n=1 Tax=Novipirellula artificiosorum TaxID=2528016 RepID=A0A5C6DKF8_9BACT|nr:DUF2141 domain-containing protein [Novipirellula artificiosorum]TWU37072.1 hypothetical protein Poly41_31980 [Novipirellula artificiosorum]
MPPNDDDPYDVPLTDRFTGRWQQNHGNLIMAFLAGLLILGLSTLVYRQVRFVPPRFPDGDSLAPQRKLLQQNAGIGESFRFRVLGAANDRGKMVVAVFTDAESFPQFDKSVQTTTTAISDGVAEGAIDRSGLPGSIAIGVFHDENEDGVLNKNTLGAPSERYGFSNNPRVMEETPLYEEAEMELPSDGATIDLSVR